MSVVIFTKAVTLQQVASKLQVSTGYLKDFIRIHPDLYELMQPYIHTENLRKNKKIIPPSVTNMIVKKFV